MVPCELSEDSVHPGPGKHPGASATKPGLPHPALCYLRQAGTNPVSIGGYRLRGYQRKWVYRGVEVGLCCARQISEDVECDGTGERMSSGCTIARLGDLCGNQHGHSAAGRGQLKGTFKKGNSKVGTVAVRPLRAPPAIAAIELLSHERWNGF
jgi:hypothetical protein